MAHIWNGGSCSPYPDQGGPWAWCEPCRWGVPQPGVNPEDGGGVPRPGMNPAGRVGPLGPSWTLQMGLRTPGFAPQGKGRPLCQEALGTHLPFRGAGYRSRTWR